MRIRRRQQAQAQAQALIPSPLHHPSDPSTAPPNQHHWLSGEEAADAEEESKSGELHRPNVDLADEPSQGNNVLGGRSSQNASGRGGGGAQRQGAQDGHGSLGNGHREQYQWPVISAGEERLVNGVVQAMPAPTAAVQHAKEGIKNDGPKRRRSAAVLLEGSGAAASTGEDGAAASPRWLATPSASITSARAASPGAPPTVVAEAVCVAPAGPSSAAPSRPAVGRVPPRCRWSPSPWRRMPPSLPALRHI